MKTGLTVNVLRDARRTDGVNDSDRHDRYVVIDPEIEGPFKPSDEEPKLVLVRRDICGPYIHAVPAHLVGLVTAFGGNFVWTCDSRFRKVSQYPIPVHDQIF